MKTYTAVIAGLALVSASAISAGEDNMKTGIQSASGHQTQTSLATINPDMIEGKNVMDGSGNELGDIDEVVVDKAKRRMVVIGLNDSMKEVALPISDLMMSADGESFTTTRTRAELEAMPDYDPMDMESAEE